MKKAIPFVCLIFCLFAWIVQAEVGIKNPAIFLEKLISSSTSNVAFVDPVLSGPEKLCNVVGSVRGTFSGGGDPDTDVYKWTILDPDGQILFTRPPGAFESIEYTFELVGAHKVLLEVSRGGILIGNFVKAVDIINGPAVTLLNSYQICPGQSLSIKAIAESSADFPNYTFIWTDESNTVIGNSNELIINNPGIYSVDFYILDGQSNPQCQTILTTSVSQLDAISIVQSSNTVCKDQSISFETNPLTIGQWTLTIPGETNPKFLGRSSQITLFPNIDLPSFGEYELKVVIENPDNPSCSPEATTSFIYNVEPFIEILDAKGASGCFIPDGSLDLIALTNIDQLIVDGLGLSFGPFSAGDPINIPNLESGAYTIFAELKGCITSFGTVVPLLTPPTNIEFEVENITSESCTDTGKERGSFEINLLNGVTEGSFRVINERGDELIKDALPNENPFKISLGGGRYFFEILDKDSCNLPNKQFIEIPLKSQTDFFIPERLVICQSYDLIPATSQDLLFALTYPAGNIVTKVTGEAFTISEEGEYVLVGTLPNQDDICPYFRILVITTTDPIIFDPVLKSEDCIIGNRTYTAEVYDTDPNSVNYFWRNELGDIIGTGKDLFLSPNSTGLFSLEVQPNSSTLCPISPKEFEVKEPVLFVDASITSTKLCEFGPEAVIELTTTSPEVVKFIEWRRFDELGKIVELPELSGKFTFTTRIGGTYEASIFSAIKPGINTSCELARVNLQLDLTPDKVDFDIPDNLSICETYSLVPTTNQNLEFEVTKPDGSLVNLVSGESIVVDQSGIYTFFAFDIEINGPICPEIKQMDVQVNQKISFSPEFIEETCQGTKTYKAEIGTIDPSSVVFNWFDSSGSLMGTDQFLILATFGQFSLDVQPAGSIPCEQTPIPFEAKAPILFVDASITATKLCEFGTDAIIELSFTSQEAVKSIEWRRFNELGDIVDLPEFNNQLVINTKIEGTYEATLFSEIKTGINTSCELARVDFQLKTSPDKVDFDIPDNLSICETYSFVPITNQNLEFEVTKPDGSSVNLVSGEIIVVDQSGIYTFFAFDQGINGTQCPEIKQMDVQVNQKISFSPEFSEETCEGTKTYKAEIGTIDPSSVVFNWFNSSGSLIGTDQFLTLATFGQFSLDVQPAGSIPCDQTPISFTVEPPLLSQDVKLISGPLCPDAVSTLIEAETAFENVGQTQWWFTALNGVQSQLTDELNKQSITASIEGTYEIRIFNSIGCQLGFDRFLLMRSMDTVRPVVKETYKVCPRYEIGPTINPGNFQGYEWYLENQLISTSAIFKPTLPGNYTLIVESAEGCTYSTTFITEEECELRVSYPNAIQPGNPDKEFLIYTNFLVDKLKVSIFSRWGELIYFCEKTDLISSESACDWDGTYSGKAIPNGSYTIRIDLENFEKKISKVQNGFILVIE